MTSDTHRVTQGNLHCALSGVRVVEGVGGGLRPLLFKLFVCSLSGCNLRTTLPRLVTLSALRSLNQLLSKAQESPQKPAVDLYDVRELTCRKWARIGLAAPRGISKGLLEGNSLEVAFL